MRQKLSAGIEPAIVPYQGTVLPLQLTKQEPISGIEPLSILFTRQVRTLWRQTDIGYEGFEPSTLMYKISVNYTNITNSRMLCIGLEPIRSDQLGLSQQRLPFRQQSKVH